MSADRRAGRDASVVSVLARFLDDEGLGAGTLRAGEVIEAFVSVGLGEHRSSTKGTYRSVLRRLARVEAPRSAPGYRGSVAPAPYLAEDRAELYSIARAQPRAWRRHSALCLLGLGIGAGLRRSEIVAAVGTDVVFSPPTVSVRVGGARERLVAVNDHEAGLVSALATISGGGYLFHPEEADRSYKNFVNDFCRQLVCDPGAPRLSVSRCRSSYICDHLATGTRLSLLLEQAGIEDVESLVRYTGHVEGSPRSKAALRHLLAGEGP